MRGALVPLALAGAALASYPSLDSAVAKCQSAPIPTGGCATLPPTSVCAPYFPKDQQVYLPTGVTLASVESAATTQVKSALINKQFFSTECFDMTVNFICASHFFECLPSGNASEPLPILTCAQLCSDYWAACNATFLIDWSQVVKSDYKASTIPNCLLGGTFDPTWVSGGVNAVPQPPDVWGGRVIPGWLPPIAGINGTVLFPLDTYTYNFGNGSSVVLNCRIVNESIPVTTSTLPATTCTPPMILSPDGKSCGVPCPFPVYTDEVQTQVEWAFIIPAIVGLVLCIFTCLDSLFVIYDASGGRIRRALRGIMHSSSDAPSSNHGTAASPKSGSSSGNKQVRASTLYVLFGSLLGMLYFIVGPLMSLIYWDQISCTDPYINLQSVSDGNLPSEPSPCVAQRVAPFLLQAIFNLILYAMIRVYWVISRRVQNLQSNERFTLEVALILYCVGLPILTLIISFALDKLSTDVFNAAIQLSRQSTYCQFRLTQTAEWLLIFAPFISTGVGVVLMSVRIAYKLLIAREKLGAAGITKARTASDVALQLLIFRLMALGLVTFVVLIIVIGSTSLVTRELTAFAPVFATFFSCLAQNFECVDCTQWSSIAASRLPRSAVLAVQLASMSCIVVLFGVFFSAQSISRLYKEWKEGSLQPKLQKLFGTKMLSSHKETMRSSKSGHDGTAVMSSFNEEFIVENNVLRAEKQVTPASPTNKSDLGVATPAAYMSTEQ